MNVDTGRVWAMVRKELREYRRNRFIIYTMAVLPLVFLIVPISEIFRVPATAPSSTVHVAVGTTLLLLLIVPVVLPASLAAYAVVGEREQGTLEPLLTTPIRRQELLIGKALAAIVPATALAYLLFAIFVTAVRIWGHPAVVSEVWQAPQFLAQALFAPLLAGWSIWIGMAISARSSDVRVAQQLGTLASLPALGVVSLMTFQVLQPSLTLAIALALGLLVADIGAAAVVARLFDRERLITGVRSTARRGSAAAPPAA